MINEEFDVNSIDRIFELMKISGRCRIMSEKLMRDIALIKSPYTYIPSANFFSAMGDVIDVSVVTLINEEVSASRMNREPLVEILTQVISRTDSQDSLTLLESSTKRCQSIFKEGANFYIGSVLLDFIVSTYSTFEFYTCKLHDGFFEKNQPSKTKRKEIELILHKCLNDHENSSIDFNFISTQILTGLKIYKSGSEKIEYTMSEIRKNHSAEYAGDIKKDREIIKYYRLMRNSIHNLGAHSGMDFITEGKSGSVINFSKDEFIHVEKYSDIFALCDQILGIYDKIIRSIGLTKINPILLLDTKISGNA